MFIIALSAAIRAADFSLHKKFFKMRFYWGFDTVIKYRILKGGTVKVDIDMQPYGDGFPEVLGRIGVFFELDGKMKHCRWLGRGPEENYPDCKANAPIGIYDADVQDMHFCYDVPQETGNHEDCRRVTVTGEEGSLTAEGKFSFSFHNFTLENLSKARHCDELEESEHNFLYIDYRQRGLGSHSCGPEPEKEYELPIGNYRWSFCIKTKG